MKQREGYILISPFRSTREVPQCRSRAVPTARLSHQPQHTPARFCRAACAPSTLLSRPEDLTKDGHGPSRVREQPSARGLTKTSYWAETGRCRHQTGQAGFSSLIQTDSVQRDSTALAATLSSLPKAPRLSLVLQKPAVFSVKLHMSGSV